MTITELLAQACLLPHSGKAEKGFHHPWTNTLIHRWKGGLAYAQEVRLSTVLSGA